MYSPLPLFVMAMVSRRMMQLLLTTNFVLTLMPEHTSL